LAGNLRELHEIRASMGRFHNRRRPSFCRDDEKLDGFAHDVLSATTW